MAETIKGLNIKLGLDATELNESLGKVRAELKEQQADLKAINQKLKYDSSNVELWKSKQTLLCLNCGNKLEMIPHHKEKKYCNDRCRYEYWNKKRGSKND